MLQVNQQELSSLFNVVTTAYNEGLGLTELRVKVVLDPTHLYHHLQTFDESFTWTDAPEKLRLLTLAKLNELTGGTSRALPNTNTERTHLTNAMFDYLKLAKTQGHRNASPPLLTSVTLLSTGLILFACARHFHGSALMEPSPVYSRALRFAASAFYLLAFWALYTVCDNVYTAFMSIYHSHIDTTDHSSAKATYSANLAFAINTVFQQSDQERLAYDAIELSPEEQFAQVETQTPTLR